MPVRYASFHAYFIAVALVLACKSVCVNVCVNMCVCLKSKPCRGATFPGSPGLPHKNYSANSLSAKQANTLGRRKCLHVSSILS